MDIIIIAYAVSTIGAIPPIDLKFSSLNIWSMKILIAEDDRVSRKYMHDILSKIGECTCVDNGREAVMQFKQALRADQPFDLVTMDIMMPEMDGHEAVRLIRATEIENGIGPQEEVPIIMTTALDDTKNVVSAFDESGATSYLVKPIMKARLLEELGKLGLGQ